MGSAPNQTPPPYWNGYKDYLKEYEKMHTVRLTKGFWILETEVTQKIWTALGGVNVSDFPGVSKPAHNVSWFDCQEALTRLNNESGVCTEEFIFRLPTEAEWEYASRAGTTTPFFWGSTLNGDKANCAGNYPYGTSTEGAYLNRTTAVGSYDANLWGLFDMRGNVCEWCADWYDDYGSGSQTDPTGPKSGSRRVFRGGGWYDDAEYCRSAHRSYYVVPAYQHDPYGFRLVLGRELK